MVEIKMRRYLDTFLRYWYIALLPVIVLPLAVYRLDNKETRTQTAYASQYIRASQSVLGSLTIYNSGQTPAQNEAAIISQFVHDPSFDQIIASTTPTYAQALARRGSAGPDAVTDLSSNVQVSALGYDLVSVSYSSDTGDPRVAQAVLGSVLAQADQQTMQQQAGLYNEQLVTLNKQQTAVKKRMSLDDKALLVYLRRKHFGFTSDAIAQHAFYDPTLSGLSQQVQTDQGRINSIVGTVEDTQGKLDALGPSTPGGQSTFAFDIAPQGTIVHGVNKRLIALLVALALGLLLGGGFVVLRTALDRSLRFVDDVPQLLELPVLGVVPHARQRTNGRGGADASRTRSTGA